MPIIPQSEFWAIFLQETGQKCSDCFCRLFLQIFILEFPGIIAARNFTENLRHVPQCTPKSSFTAETLGAAGPDKIANANPLAMCGCDCMGR